MGSPVNDLARELRFYRLSTFVLLAIAAGLAFMLPRPARTAPAPATPVLEFHDIFADVSKVEQIAGNQTDFAHPYFASPAGTIHMHVLGRTQRTPLHFHRASTEATLIVSGGPVIRHVYGTEGRLVTRLTHAEPLALIVSPPHCGHEWANPSPDRMQANLVFASPPFDGNLHVTDDDSRLLEGGQPSIIPLLETDGRGLPHGMSLVDASDAPVTLEAMHGPSALFVLRGSGSVSGGRSYDFHQGMLIVVPEMTKLRVFGGKSGARLLSFRPGERGAASTDAHRAE
jgi:hypothetical protein